MHSNSRRRFLQSLGITAAAATAVSFPELGPFAFAEPRRAPVAGGPILLNSNENAYGPSERTVAAMGESLRLTNRYPDAHYDALLQRIASKANTKTDNVLMGCGSGELLRAAALAFTGPGKRLITASPTFESLGHHAERAGAKVTKVPLTSTFAHDVDAMLQEARADASPALIYICNPNNPTASLTPRRDLDRLIAGLPKNALLLMDEAYHHFATTSPDYVSYLEKPASTDQVFVLRTFSKIYGLAGLRLGYAVASAALVRQMRPHLLFDNVNMVAAVCAVSALDDDATVEASRARNAADGAEFARQAKQRGLSVVPSVANFVMMDTRQPISRSIEHFKRNGILIGRPFPPMETYARISLGRPEEMREFWRVWDAMAKG